ncbi:MAG: prolyl oligopeptidase family serine peptidase [Anaerolineaceae bacterium]|nr:prolyl oligopeptidase family serine peptidase [Anaerolineaceae bacterium]
MSNLLAMTATLVLLLGIHTFGAQETLAQSTDFVGTFTYDGLERVYRLYIPESAYSITAIPLVFAIHGGGGNWEHAAQNTGLDAVAEREGFALVYPNALDHHWNDGRESERIDPAIDDVGFLVALAEFLVTEYNLDPARIYATGISNGGMMSLRLACEASTTFAGVAAVAASMPVGIAPVCAPEQPIALLMLNGDADPLVPYEGGDLGSPAQGTIISVPDSVALWVELDGCDAEVMTIEELPNTARFDDTRVILTRYTDCADEILVYFYHVVNGGHTWPGGDPNVPRAIVGRVSRDINASDVIWDFFTHFSRDLP